MRRNWTGELLAVEVKRKRKGGSLATRRTVRAIGNGQEQRYLGEGIIGKYSVNALYLEGKRAARSH